MPNIKTIAATIETKVESVLNVRVRILTEI